MLILGLELVLSLCRSVVQDRLSQSTHCVPFWRPDIIQVSLPLMRKSLWLNQAEIRVSKIIFHSCETHTHISLSEAHHCISLHATLFPGICCYDNVLQHCSLSAKLWDGCWCFWCRSDL